MWYTTPSTTSASPIDKLRWKFVASSQASHRQNSTAENNERLAGVVRSLRIVTCQISSVSPRGNEVTYPAVDAGQARFDRGVSEPVAALVGNRAAYGTAARWGTRTEAFRGQRAIVVEVEVTSVGVEGCAVVAVACEAPEACVLVEGIAAARVGDQPEELSPPR